MSKSDQPIIPKFLQDLEQNRWQIELVISGGLVYTLYQIPEYVKLKLVEVSQQASIETSTAIIFVGMVVLSRALLIGFSVNLLLRALWLAYLGVYFSYPKGIDFKQLGYSDIFQEKIQRENNSVDRIMKLERYCSLSYSIAVLISIVSVGVLFLIWFLFAFVLNQIMPVEWYDDQIVGYVIFALFVLIALGAIDRLVFGVLGKRKKLNRLFYPISKLLSLVFFTWVFRYEWLTLISNMRRWKIHLLATTYFFIALMISVADLGASDIISDSFMKNPFDERKYKTLPLAGVYLDNDEYDENLSEKYIAGEASIPSEIVSSNLLPVFIAYDQYMDKYFQYRIEQDSIIMNYRDIKSQMQLKENGRSMQMIFRDLFNVSIDTMQVDSIRWFYRTHPITKQEGFHAKLDISDLSIGAHNLNLNFIGQLNENKIDSSVIRWIPFWKEN